MPEAVPGATVGDMGPGLCKVRESSLTSSYVALQPSPAPAPCTAQGADTIGGPRGCRVRPLGVLCQPLGVPRQAPRALALPGPEALAQLPCGEGGPG